MIHSTGRAITCRGADGGSSRPADVDELGLALRALLRGKVWRFGGEEVEGRGGGMKGARQGEEEGVR